MGMTIDEFEEYAKSHNILTMTKDFYENRLKADLEAILVELQLEIEEIVHEERLIDKRWADGLHYSEKIIQQKINSLKEVT